METLRLGEAIKFGSKGNATGFMGAGWSTHQNSPTSTWSVDHVATLNLRLAGGAPRIKLTLEAAPFLSDDKVLRQEMNIYLNGSWIGFVHAEEFSATTHVFAGDLVNAAAGNLFSFVIPTARVPAKLGMGSDLRCLGFAFQSIALDRA